MSEHIPSQAFVSEADVRRLRDMVYGMSISDKEWAMCGQYWMKPENVAWLQQKAQDVKEAERA